MDNKAHTIGQVDSPGREFWRYAAPATMGLLLTSAITIVDGIFIAYGVGPTALAGVNLTVPVVNAVIAWAVMIAAGGAVRTMHALSREEFSVARVRFRATMGLYVVGTVVLVTALVVFFEPLLALIGARGTLYAPTRDYLRVLRWFYPISVLNIVLGAFCRAEGKPALPMVYGIVGNALNVLLDYLFILRWGWGLEGAALASGVSMALSAVLHVRRIAGGQSRFYGAILTRWEGIRAWWGEASWIIYNGSSELVGNVSISVCTWLCNRAMLAYGGIPAVVAYTAVGYVVFVHGMVLSGVSIGLSAPVARSSATGNLKRAEAVRTVAQRVGIGVGAFLWVAVAAGAPYLAALFSHNDSEVIAMARVGFPIFASALLFSAGNEIAAGYYTAVGDARRSLVVALLRGVGLTTLLIIVLPRVWGLLGVWLTFPVAEIVTAAVVVVFRRRDARGIVTDTPHPRSCRPASGSEPG